jgi:hypothetical protein
MKRLVGLHRSQHLLCTRAGKFNFEQTLFDQWVTQRHGKLPQQPLVQRWSESSESEALIHDSIQLKAHIKKYVDGRTLFQCMVELLIVISTWWSEIGWIFFYTYRTSSVAGISFPFF